MSHHRHPVAAVFFSLGYGLAKLEPLGSLDLKMDAGQRVNNIGRFRTAGMLHASACLHTGQHPLEFMGKLPFARCTLGS